MRTFLLLSTAGLILFANGCTKAAPEYRTGATIKDLMDSVVDPNADFLWDAVSITSNLQGIVEKSPKTEEEWREVRRHAIALMESTNLLQMPGRSVARPGEKADDPRVELDPAVIQTLIDGDRASWAEHARALYDATAYKKCRRTPAIRRRNRQSLPELPLKILVSQSSRQERRAASKATAGKTECGGNVAFVS